MTPGFNYVVTEGDCISSLAMRYGFVWQKVWDANPDLKSLRQNPNVLFPGDVVKIPDRVEKLQPCATDQRHKFVKTGTPAKFRLVVERFNVPLANRRYILTIDGKVFEGQTDGTGLLEVHISPAARTGHLTMPDDQLKCPLALGNLDPVDQVNGIQQRLQNLGFLNTEPNGEMDEETRTAIMYFQASVDLPASGELDDATRNQLLQMHDQEHPQRTEQDQAPDAADSGSGGPEEIEPEINPEEDEAELARFQSLDD